MYYKIKNNILFRQYGEYGYITDNSMFGYSSLKDASFISPGEKYVSKSGSIMLGLLSKSPQHIDSIVEKLANIFIGVDYEQLKQDTIDFFDFFVESGFLSRGNTFDNCFDELKFKSAITNTSDSDKSNSVLISNDCSRNVFSQNDFLRSLHIEISSKCNERCVHCYIPHQCKNKTMDSNLFYRILTEGHEMNIINVTISGGEPLLHKDFTDFLIKCREFDLSVNVLTNLTLLTDEIISEMKKNPLLSVQTSIYSMESSVHDSITKLRGSLEKTKSALLKLKESKIPVQISCPIMKQNKDSFSNVISFGDDNDIAVMVEPVIFASYDHSNDNLINRLSFEEAEQVFNKLVTEKYIKSLWNMAKKNYELVGQDSICSVCRYNICISAEGIVFPCSGWQSKVLGNLNNQTLREIWESSKIIQKLRLIKRENFPKCVECEDRGYCKVCMMSNSNENTDGDSFRINDYHCKIAAMKHRIVNSYLKNNKLMNIE